jgi:hypothetical protein
MRPEQLANAFGAICNGQSLDLYVWLGKITGRGKFRNRQYGATTLLLGC